MLRSWLVWLVRASKQWWRARVSAGHEVSASLDRAPRLPVGQDRRGASLCLVVEGGYADVDAGRLAVGCPPFG